MGHPDVVEYLLKQGADPDFHKERFTALMAACASTRENEDKLVKCVDLLIKHKTDINATERHHISALMFAAKEGHAKIVSKLVNCSCTLDLQDGQGWTALFWAVNQGKVKVVEILVKAGASVDMKDRCGQTAVDLAYNKGLDEILNIFNNKNELKALGEEQCVNTLSSDKIFSNLYEEMVLKSHHNSTAENRYEKHNSGILVSVGKVNGIRLKQHGCKYKKKEITKNSGHSKTIEKFKQDQNFNRIAVTKPASNEVIPWNTPYSLGDAVLLMKTTIKHLGVLYAGTSYIRLRLQGRLVDLPVEKKYSDAAGLASLTEKALHQTHILQEELEFLHKHIKKLEESEKIIPADVVVQRRDSSYKKLTSFVLVSVMVVLVYNRANLSKILNY